MILESHKGAGALIRQELWAGGIEPISHTPLEADSDPTSLKGDALTVLNHLDSSSLDAVIDTIGGRDIWEESRRVLRNGGLVSSHLFQGVNGSDFFTVHHSRRRIYNCIPNNFSSMEIKPPFPPQRICQERV
jgi:hypothetical protein